MHDSISGNALLIPRGTPNLAQISLDLTEVYGGERRLVEVRAVNPLTAPDLMGYFNQVCNTTSKYLAWVEYEILQAKKYVDLARSTVLLEKAPAAFAHLKDTGIKYNEDFRDALVIKDPDYQKALDILNHLTATKVFLESKSWSFIRAYNACKYVATTRGQVAASPNLNGTIGQTYDEPQDNFMGKSRID